VIAHPRSEGTELTLVLIGPTLSPVIFFFRDKISSLPVDPIKKTPETTKSLFNPLVHLCQSVVDLERRTAFRFAFREMAFPC